MIKKILIIDDEKDLVSVTKLRLEANGYLVSVAFTVEQGLEQIEKNRPDLVLLDIMLPDGDGYQVCQKLKLEPKTKDIPVIIITASRLHNLAKRSVEAGAVGYLAKPFEVKDLLEKVNRRLAE